MMDGQQNIKRSEQLNVTDPCWEASRICCETRLLCLPVRLSVANRRTATGRISINFLWGSSFYIIVTLLDDGRNYRPKHVVVNVINK